MKIGLVETDVPHTDGHMDGYTHMKKLTVTFRNNLNSLKINFRFSANTSSPIHKLSDTTHTRKEARG
jgi:hypothetical protein